MVGNQNASDLHEVTKGSIPNTQKEKEYENSRNIAKIRAQSKFLMNLIKSEKNMDRMGSATLSMMPSTLTKGQVTEK